METISSKKKVLILDKTSRMTSTIDDIKYLNNFDIHLIYDPNSVYEKARVLNPDLIILDYLFLDHDCALVCEDLKGDKRLKGIPIIVLTTFKTKKNQEETYNCDAFCIKSLDIETLTSHIKYLIAS